jgi:hypothetical protein
LIHQALDGRQRKNALELAKRWNKQEDCMKNALELAIVCAKRWNKQEDCMKNAFELAT